MAFFGDFMADITIIDMWIRHIDCIVCGESDVSRWGLAVYEGEIVPDDHLASGAALRAASVVTYELAEIIWPHDTHSKAWKYQSNGGPPGWVMPLGKAIKWMGLRTEYKNGRKLVFPRHHKFGA